MRLFLFRFPIWVLALFMFPARTMGADDMAQRLEKANEMAFIIEEQGILDQGLKVYLQSVQDSQREDLRNVLDIHFDSDDIINRLIPIIAEIYTTQEMSAMIDFYSTPTGRSVLQKRSLATQKMSEAISQSILDSIARYKDQKSKN